MANGDFKKLVIRFRCGNCKSIVPVEIEESELDVEHDTVNNEWNGKDETRYSIDVTVDCPKCKAENWIPIRKIEYFDPDF